MRETASTCPYCGVGCGVVIEHDGTQITGVRGDPDHPANFGRLCTKGSTLAQTATPIVLQTQRLLQPRDRAGALSWDAANSRFTYTYAIPATATAVDFVFNNGAGTWDNNGGADWHVAVTGGAPPPPGRNSTTSRRNAGGRSSARHSAAAATDDSEIDHAGYSPTTTVCATSLDRRSHTPAISAKYRATNGSSSSPCPAGANPPMTARAVMLAIESSPTTVSHTRSLTAACGRAARAAAA